MDYEGLKMIITDLRKDDTNRERLEDFSRIALGDIREINNAILDGNLLDFEDVVRKYYRLVSFVIYREVIKTTQNADVWSTLQYVSSVIVNFDNMIEMLKEKNKTILALGRYSRVKDVLIAVAQKPWITHSELANKLGMSKGNLTNTIKRVAHLGLFTNLSLHNFKMYDLTRAGRKALEDLCGEEGRELLTRSISLFTTNVLKSVRDGIKSGKFNRTEITYKAFIGNDGIYSTSLLSSDVISALDDLIDSIKLKAEVGND